MHLTAPVGLIGLGLIGTAITQRLVQAGINVVCWDIAEERRSAIAAMGGRIAADVETVCRTCRHILLSLPNDQIVASVMSSVRPVLLSGQCILDTSTGAPETAHQLFAGLADSGVHYLDATISGSSAQLLKGEAVFLVGASEPAFQECHSVLQLLSSKIFHTGPPGSGAQMKLVTNLVLGLNRAALAEGLSYASALGLDLAMTFRLLRESMSYSRIMDTKGEKMIAGDFAPQARLAQHLKDVQLMLADGQRLQARLPLTQTHRQLLEEAVAMGLGELDNSAIIRAFDVRKTDGLHET